MECATKTRVLFIVVSLIFTIGCSVAIKGNVKTEPVRSEDIEGVYTLLLYGSRHSNDIETVAILDKEGDKYTFEIYAPDFDYKVIKGVPAQDALNRANGFINWHHSFQRARLSRIFDDKGATIGYELRPLYDPFIFGVSDVLDVWYWLRDDRVIVRIKLIPMVEKMLFMDGSPKDSGN